MQNIPETFSLLDKKGRVYERVALSCRPHIGETIIGNAGKVYIITGIIHWHQFSPPRLEVKPK